MEMLGLKKTLDRMAKANRVRWYGDVIRRDDDNILKKAMMLEVSGQRNEDDQNRHGGRRWKRM